MLTLGVIMCILPWNQITSEISPFVAIFNSVGFNAAAAILQVVLITAALSAINADIYGAGRMLHGLAEQGQAPRSFARTSRNGVPVMTVITMVVALLVGVLLNYLYPDQALFLLGALATFATLLVWLVILGAHLRMKRVIARDNRLPSEFPVPLWPLGSWLTVASSSSYWSWSASSPTHDRHYGSVCCGPSPCGCATWRSSVGTVADPTNSVTAPNPWGPERTVDPAS